MMLPRRTRLAFAAAAATGLICLAGCSAIGQHSEPSGKTVTVLTHDSFAVSKDVLAEFEQKSGLTVKFVAPGDGGELTNQLILTKDHPLGDVAFGVDNTFASRALKAQVFQPYTSPNAGAEQQAHRVGEALSAIDYSDVCVNVDHRWFTEHKLAEPATLDDLAKPAYKNLLVAINPATSSPGMAWLLATIGAYGEHWPDYWTKLRANGVKIDSGWSDAYYVDFSGSDGHGPRPLVVSYASSPPAEVKDGAATTGALLDTCFRQVEYAGVLAGAANPSGGQQFVDFMLSKSFQQDLPGQMFVYPIKPDTPMPADWKYAPLSPHPYSVPAAKIEANRESWITGWTDLMEG